MKKIILSSVLFCFMFCGVVIAAVGTLKECYIIDFTRGGLDSEHTQYILCKDPRTGGPKSEVTLDRKTDEVNGGRRDNRLYDFPNLSLLERIESDGQCELRTYGLGEEAYLQFIQEETAEGDVCKVKLRLVEEDDHLRGVLGLNTETFTTFYYKSAW